LKNGKSKAGGLAGAGLGGAQQVFAGEDDGDGLRLDGGGLGVALLGDDAKQLRAKAEAFECVTNGVSPEIGLRRACLRPVQADAF
jgi:hypothetical protein